MAKKGTTMTVPRNHSMLMKKIPLHYQKKLTNISNGMLNTTLMTGIYKNKIKTLLKNNKVLAVALQNDRSKKEELLEENKANANIITFSRLKLASLSDNLKQVVTVLDETLSLLQMHSSVSSTKLTPKHTVGREEFKDQVKEVLMDCIPEEEEPQSPQRESNVECLNKEQREDDSSEFQLDMTNQKCDSIEEVGNSRKPLRPNNLNKEKSKQRSDNINMDTITCAEKYKSGASTATDNNFDERSPAKTTAQFKKFSAKKKNLTSEVFEKKTENKSTARKKCGTTTKKVAWDDTKKIKCSNKNKQFENPSKSKPHQNKLYNEIQVCNDMPKSKMNSENQSIDSTCILKQSVSPSKLHDNVVDNTCVISDGEKENVSSFKKQKLSTRKFKSLDDFAAEPTVTIRTSRCSALQNLSSKINIENFKSSGSKRKTFCTDDLITTKQKGAEFMQSSKSPNNCDNSRSYLQDLSLHQQEMVKNLAVNTFLVTAEVHRSPEPLKTDKIKLPKGLSNLKQPIVLVKDIFAHSKSLCKSISDPACDKLNEVPLEMQLLEHYSSLKIIPEESNSSQENSTHNGSDKTEEKVPRKKIKNSEPSLSVEAEFIEQQPLQETKREFRKRSVSINYKERPTNIKLRR